MLKVLLVDDESLARNGFRQSIRWEDHGFQVAAEAANGIEALEALKTTEIDLIVTDIKMPFLDGVELLKIVKAQYPLMFCVMLSGYGEFSLAQQAIKLGASGYLLKPVQSTELFDILYSVKEKHRGIQSYLQTLFSMKENVNRLEPALQVQELSRLLLDQTEHLPIELIQGLGLPPDHFCACVMVLVGKSSKPGDHIKARFYAEFSWLEKELPTLNPEGMQSFVLPYYSIQRLCLLLYCPKKISKDSLASLLSGLRGKPDCPKITVAFSSFSHRCRHIKSAFRECCEAADKSFLGEAGGEVFFDEMTSHQQEKNIDELFSITEIAHLISCNDQEAIKGIFANLLEQIQTLGLSSEYVKSYIVAHMHIQAQKLLAQSGHSMQEVFENPVQQYTNILRADTAVQMISMLLDFILTITDYYGNEAGSRQKQLVEKAKQYVRHYYSNSKLSLEEVASSVNVTKNYLSFLFKRESGTTFSSWLRDLRMDEAMRLLKSKKYCVYEVSEMVGYGNVTWFSTNFKKYTGESPTDYR